MPDNLNTLGSLIDEVKHTQAPPSAYPAVFLTGPTGYLTLWKGLTGPVVQGPWRLPTEGELAALLVQLAPKPPAGAPSSDTIAITLEQEALQPGTGLPAAVNSLAQLDWPGIWAVIDRLATRGPTLGGQTHLELIEQPVSALPNVDPRVIAAILVGLLSRGGRTISTGAITGWLRLAALLTILDPLSQLEVLGHLGVPPEAAEGAMVMMLAEAYDAGVDALFDRAGPGGLAASMAAAPAWLGRLGKLLVDIDPNADTFLDSSPGKQYYGWYLGSEVHRQIAEFYKGKHSGHFVRTNHTPVQSILQALETKFRFQGSPLAAALALARPDIFEFEEGWHGMPPGWVYEIKPASEGAGAATAAFEAKFYATAISLCDIPVEPGQAAAIGTEGVVPVPHGWAAFVSPLPGVIVYRVVYASAQAIAQRRQARAHSALRDRIEQGLRVAAPAAAAAALALLAALLLVLCYICGFILAF
jgi:hypothetical protein